jgi:hypothetical protein
LEAHQNKLANWGRSALRQRYFGLSFLFALLIAVCTPLFAQVGVGGLTGTISDSTGAVIPDAKVVLTNESTGMFQTTVSSSAGTYVFNAVNAGTYSLQVTKSGFEAYVNQGIQIHIQQEPDIDVTLHPGSAVEKVTVTAEAPLLQAENFEVGQTINGEEVNDLPLEARNWVSLSQISVGVTTTPGGTPQSANFVVNGVNSGQNDYRLDGIDDNEEFYGAAPLVVPPPDALQEFKLQGGDFSAEFGHSTGAVVNAAIRSGTNSLHGDLWEYLRNNDFNANDYFAKQQGVARPGYHQNIFGGTVGGPAYLPKLYNGKNRTFFFFDYQGTRIDTPTQSTATVPTANMVKSGFTNFQDFFTLTANSTPLTDGLNRKFPIATIFDPATTRSVAAGAMDPVSGLRNTSSSTVLVRDPFMSSGSVTGVTDFTGLTSQLNIIPAGRLDPNAVKLLGIYPAATRNSLTELQNYFAFPADLTTVNTYDLRIDEQLSSKDVLFGVFNWGHSVAQVPPLLPGIANGANWGSGVNAISSYAIAAGYTHIFTPTLTNEIHAGSTQWVDNIAGSAANTSGIPAQYGIANVPQYPGNGGLPDIAISPFTNLGVAGWMPTLVSLRVLELMDNVIKLHASHTFKAGFQFDRFVAPIIQSPYPKGEFDFNGQFSSLPNESQGYAGAADMLLVPTTASVPNGIDDVGGVSLLGLSNYATVKDSRKYFAGYFQDDWKTTQKLTFNLGLRWDHFEPYMEEDGRQANFIENGGGGGSSGTFYIPSEGCANVQRSATFDALLAANNITLDCNSNKSTGNAQAKNFAPRVGFAYRLKSNLVFRGGYGIAYGALATIGFAPNLGENYPFNYTVYYSAANSQTPLVAVGGTKTATLETALASTNLEDAALVSGQGVALQGRQWNYQTPYTETYNLTVQDQFTPHDSIQVAYVGNAGRHLDSPFGEINAVSAIAPPGTNEYDPTVIGHFPFPQFAVNSFFEVTNGDSSFNSLQAIYAHQLSAGLNVNVNYTFGKCFTDQNSEGSPGTPAWRAEWLPGFGPKGDYALCNSDVKNVVHGSGTYFLPLGRGLTFGSNMNKVSNAIVGGWKVNFILTYQSGQPGDIGCLYATTAAFGCWANTVPGVGLYAQHKSKNGWLNPAAFSQPPTATAIGQVDYAPLGGQSGQYRVPGFQNLDFSLFKEFAFTEQSKLEFRAEAFNAGNWVSLGVPGNLSFNNPTTFSTINSDVDGPRIIQLALKLYY